jgi:hypothetical protein
MKHVIVVIIAVLFCSIVYSQPYEGPFGLKMGLTLSQLKMIDPNMSERKIDSVYEMTTVPIPHVDYEAYWVMMSPDSGLCKIIAVSRIIKTNPHGTDVEKMYKSHRDAIAGKYGQYLEIDDLMPGSIWDEPEDFMMALVKKERNLLSIWGTKASSNMLNDIEAIGLQVKAHASDSGQIMLTYEFHNFANYKKELDAKKDSSF